MRRPIARDQNQRKRAVGSLVSTWVNGFNPQMFPDLQLWLDAADVSTITESGGSVSQWNDKSSNGYNVTQSTAARQPLTGSVTQNGLNVIDFDGGDLLVRTTGSGLGRNVVGTSVYVVVIYDNLAGGEDIAFRYLNNTTLARVQVFLRTNSGVLGVGGRTLDADAGVFISSTAETVSRWLSQVAIFDYANTDLFQYINGELNGFTTSFQTATTTSNTQSSQIQVGNLAAFTAGLDGKLAEILVYHSAHDPLQRATVLGYLNRKWGL